jgi:hypothetical protein
MELLEIEAVLASSLDPGCSAEHRARAKTLIRKGGRISPDLALNIYGNNISGALIKALTAAYPACLRILGERCFNGIAHRFIEHIASDQPDLNQYGATFSEFLDDWTEMQKLFSEYRYLGDLARLEWLCHTAYYAQDDSPFDFMAFSTASRNSQECLRFRLGHSIGLLQSVYPVMKIREANLEEGNAAQVDAGDLPEYLVVSRPEARPQVERVDATSFLVLTACMKDMMLRDIVGIGRLQENTLAEVLPRLIQRRWITDYSVGRADMVEDSVDA